jgi:hypothetical protein
MTISEHRYVVKCIDNLKDDFSKGITVPCRQQTKVWRYMLLNNKDTVVVDGKVRQLTAKSIGAGVYELTLKGE